MAKKRKPREIAGVPTSTIKRWKDATQGGLFETPAWEQEEQSRIAKQTAEETLAEYTAKQTRRDARPPRDARPWHSFGSCGSASPPCERCKGKVREEPDEWDQEAQSRASMAAAPEEADDSEWGDFDSCLAEFRSNRCTLNGAPARIIGTPRTAPYATIEPVDLDAEPIRCCWDVVDQVMQDDGAFCRDDDDTDD